MDPTADTRVAEVTERVRHALVAAAPADWSRISLEVKATAGVCELAVGVLRSDGSPAAAAPLDRNVGADVTRLRELQYENGRGTWFAARIVVQRDGPPDLSFDIDEDPRWWPELHPTTFVRDLELFPRRDEHIPPWLRDRLAEGTMLEAEHRAAEGAEPSDGHR